MSLDTVSMMLPFIITRRHNWCKNPDPVQGYIAASNETKKKKHIQVSEFKPLGISHNII
jgi:hypothetical protein